MCTMRLRILLVMAATIGGGWAVMGQPQDDGRLQEAIAWYTGTRGRVDDVRARALIETAANDGDVLARMWTARAHARGRLGYERDEARAQTIAAEVIDEVRRRAEAGGIEAAFLMGSAHDEGLGVAVDGAAAVAWFRRAATAGHTLAEHNLGNAYAAGRGVTSDAGQAVTWWRRAAQKGDAVTQLRLGEAYESGSGVARDLAMARRWYADAAGRGNPAAARALARLGGGR